MRTFLFQLEKNSLFFINRVAIVFFWLLASSVAHAEQDQPIFSFKGFGTLAATGTDTDAIGFRRDMTTGRGATKSWDITTDSRLGLQIDAKFNESLSAVLQWVARDRTGNFFEQNLDLAFLRWTIQPDLQIRFGRISTDVFMLSDHRNVGYAYPWMRPPHEFYSGIPLYHYDGIDVTKKFEIDGGYLSMIFFGGYTSNEIKIVHNELYSQDAAVIKATVAYEKGDWRARAGYAYLYITSEPDSLPATRNALNDPILDFIWPDLKQISPRFHTIGTTIHYSDIGISYDDGIWLAQAEASYVGSDLQFFPDVASGYISLGRRISSLTLYTLFGISKTISNRVEVPNPLIPDPRLLAYQKQLDDHLNNNGVDEKSISLGLRWDFYHNIAFKAQWSHFWLGNNGTQNWIKDPNQTAPDNVNVFSVGFDFIF